MLKINTYLRPVTFFALLALTLAFLAGLLSAQTLSQGYFSDEPLQKGMLVAEKEGETGKVVALMADKLDKLKGIVVQQNDSPVTISSEGQNIFVASTGQFEVLVSSENGPIAAGDYLSISSLAGIGMKANEDQNLVIGRASAGFDGKANVIGLTEFGGRKISFTRIPTVIEIGRNPFYKSPEGTSIPRLLEKVSLTLAGKPVTPSKIWLATAVFLGSLFMTGIMLYSGARSSLVSVGRNPLSKSAIIKGLGQIVVMSFIVFIVGMFGVYLLLKL